MSNLTNILLDEAGLKYSEIQDIAKQLQNLRKENETLKLENGVRKLVHGALMSKNERCNYLLDDNT